MSDNFKKDQTQQKKLIHCRDLVLANLILLGQIPAETGQEQKRLQIILNRFNEIENLNTYCDGEMNAVGEITGLQSNKRIVISANLDTHFNHLVDHHIQLDDHHIQGPGIANNSLGLAMLVSLPEILQIFDLKFNLNIMFVATSSALGRGECKGIHHFFKHFNHPIHFCLNLAATNLGRFDHYCYSSIRGDIICEIASIDEWNRSSIHNNAIYILNELINSMLDIPIANRYKTLMNIGQINGGKSYSLSCSKASLGFYITSHSNEQVDQVISAIKDCCTNIAAKTNSNIRLDFFSHQHAGGIPFTHPLVQIAIKNIARLGYKPIISSQQSQASIPMSLGIPTMTLGITLGMDRTLPSEMLDVEPISKGIDQIISMLQHIDAGDCDE